MMARTLQPLVVEGSARASTDDRRLRYRDRTERLTCLQSGHDPRYVRYQTLRQVTHFGTRVSEAKEAVAAGLALNPTFTIRRVQANVFSDDPTYLAQRERLYDGLRKAGVHE